MSVRVVVDDETDEVSAGWDTKDSSMEVNLPATALYARGDTQGQLRWYLLNSFGASTSPIPIRTQAAPGELDEDFSELPSRSSASAESLWDPLTWAPAYRLLKKPPYHLMIRARSKHSIEVQGSHFKSLSVLADYIEDQTSIVMSPDREQFKVSLYYSHSRRCD